MDTQKIKATLLAPFRAMHRRYLPLLMIYFAFGALAFSSIPIIYWTKDILGFSPQTLASISVWISLPWTIKMIFGQMADSVPVFRSTRVSYVMIAAFFMFCGIILLAGLAGNWTGVSALGSKENIFLFANLILTVGTVLQDVVADAMTSEVVSREGKNNETIEKELAEVQLLGRLAIYTALFVCIPTGVIVQKLFGYEIMFLAMLGIPIISIAGILFIRLPKKELVPVNRLILFGGLLYAAITIGFGMSDIPYGQEVIFTLSLGILLFLLGNVAGDVSPEKIRGIICAAVIIFVFRSMPGYGPGVGWWEIDVLGFDQNFFTVLSQIGNGIAIVGMLLGIKLITEKPVSWVLGWVTIISFVLSVPTIGMYYGLHEWTAAHFGFGARTIALIDVAAASPFAQFSMIPMLALTAYYAPKGKEATWFALVGSFMNLALTGGNILTKHLTQVFVVTQAKYDQAGALVSAADYSQLGNLMLVSCAVGLIVPLLTIRLFANQKVLTK